VFAGITGRRGTTMKYFTCNPRAFVQSLTKSQRKALADVLQLPASKNGKEGPAASLRAALERAK
jgi:hypothetical protein